MGTLHCGKINALHTVLQWSFRDLLSEWDDVQVPLYDDMRGHSMEIVMKSGQGVYVSLFPMPAHLEAQDATVNGKAYSHAISLSSEKPQGSLV